MGKRNQDRSLGDLCVEAGEVAWWMQQFHGVSPDRSRMGKMTEPDCRSDARIQIGLVRNGLHRASTPVSAAVLCVGLICIFVACHSDHRESYYPTLRDADKEGATTRGWIPDLLPQSSRNIREVHEISPSTEWCVFEFVPTDSQVLRTNLKSVSALPPSVRSVPNPGVSWWPAALNGKLDVEKIHREGFEIYVVERPADSVTTNISLFAIDWSNGRGFFYSTRE